MIASVDTPRAWKADDVRKDETWIQRLSPEAAKGFNDALAHAKKTGKELLEMEQADFPLPVESKAALDQAINATQGRWGMVLVKGFPTDDWSENDMRIAYWGMSLYMGVGRAQNKASEIINDVRDTGGSYYVKGGRGYNTNVQLDFHQDYSDVGKFLPEPACTSWEEGIIPFPQHPTRTQTRTNSPQVALLCRRTAKSGGTSKVVSSIAMREAMQEKHPDLVPVLKSNKFFHSFQGAQDPSQPAYYRCPIFGEETSYPVHRTNRKDTTAAQRDFPEVPRMSAEQTEAMDSKFLPGSCCRWWEC